MGSAVLAVLLGLVILVWSADRFVEGAAATAKHLGMSPLLIGMVIMGFGTSAPELVVSVMSAIDGSPGIALGNAYGSNIANIALILGLTAVIAPIAVHSQVIRRELPILLGVTAIAALQVHDGEITRVEAIILLVLLVVLLGWNIYQGRRGQVDALGGEVEQELVSHPMPLKKALIWVAIGLILLVVSSRLLVWGAVDIAQFFGVSDLVIGLTVVAIGTSLPELASSIAAIRKNEHDMALGNVIGSNLFNTLAVVGLAGVIHPMAAEPEVFTRDMLVMGALTLALFFFAYGFRGPGRINRIEGVVLLAAFAGYTAYLLGTTFVG
ncbi:MULTISPECIES: calcium/sodium antiporter [unclassified Guyparkeria]|uniref:calcium/sodium antiporter n=1 Tax=unclassified Guyparkeria TaxID=2626246 RepID=UPI0007335142|nr:MULTISPECIES: calcium/sodium antiporter [unclassified Guyparkeria]KTG16344.1 calcium:proton antiporter [Guyparkeria sp. XI15]OAE85284.1 calcium:proton antiporter [Guyparkeria sp. WRN-7]